MIDTAKVACPFTVVIDTREQSGYSFAGLVDRDKRPLVISTMRAKLDHGDYSIFGMPGVAIERKSKADLFGSVARRENFEGRLARMSELAYAAVVVEAEWSEILKHPPPFSKYRPRSLLRTIMAWDQRYAVRWWMLPGREAAEAGTFRLLERFYLDHRERPT